MNVYILKSGDFFKVGISVNVERRIRELQTGSPHLIELLALKWCGNPARHNDQASAIERQIHKEVSEYNSYDEWFRLPPGEYQRIIDKYKFQTELTGLMGPTPLLSPVYPSDKPNRREALPYKVFTEEEESIRDEWSEHLTNRMLQDSE